VIIYDRGSGSTGVSHNQVDERGQTTTEGDEWGGEGLRPEAGGERRVRKQRKRPIVLTPKKGSILPMA